MAYHNPTSPLFSLRALLPAVLLVCTLLGICSCNEKTKDDDDAFYQEPSSLAITGFKLKADAKILRGLDSVFFTIDLQKAVIYNADSLPVGTRITDLIPVITYSQYINDASIQMTGGTKRNGTTNYLKNPNDSIDFTGDVVLTIGSSTGGMRSYTLKVNVHKQQPDSLAWGETAISKLPSTTDRPLEQRTVKADDKVVTLIKESDGTFTLATTPDPATTAWTTLSVNFPSATDVRSLTAAPGCLYMLIDGFLCTSTDGTTWTPTAEKWETILGAYSDSVLGVKKSGTDFKLTSYPGGIDIDMPDNFPAYKAGNMYQYQSEWMAQPIGVVCGGMSRDGEPLSTVWAYDGTRWAMLSDNQIPALYSPTVIPYYSYINGKYVWINTRHSALLLWGGLKDDRTVNRTLYISYNNGVSWTEAPQLLQMPKYIPGMYMADNVVLPQQKQGSLDSYWSKMPAQKLPAWYRVDAEVSGGTVSWECPYIYLFGGHTSDGFLSTDIWRGVINRLTFMPIF